MPKADNTRMVAIPVPTGKRQNSHSIVAEERTTVAMNPQILVRACADVVMPAPESTPISDKDFIPVKYPNRHMDTPLNYA